MIKTIIVITETVCSYFLSTHADRQGVDISFTFCNFCSFVCLFVCTITDFSTEDKASGVTFCIRTNRPACEG